MMGIFGRRPALAAAVAVVSLAALIVGILFMVATPTVQQPAGPAASPEAPPAPRRPPPGLPTAEPTTGPPIPLPDWRVSSTRLEDAARTLGDALREAEKGDADALYHVARVVRFCASDAGAAPGAPESARRACGEILANPGLRRASGEGPAEAWVAALNESVRAGNPRAMAYAALHCVHGSPCDPMSGEDRGMSLASAQSRAGRAIASGDPEAIFHAGLAIADDAIGRNAVKGAAWMLLACARGYDCSAANQLNEMLACPAGRPGCVPGANVGDYLESRLGSSAYARAFALSQEYGQLLQAGEPPVRSWSFGR